jgi:hypothetical protein
MEETDIGTKQLLIRVKPSLHKRLVVMTLKRSVELGRRVGMSFVIEEMMDKEEQINNPESRMGELFGSHD